MQCRSAGDHISVVVCGLIRPDPTPIILAVSLTSGFPRHHDAGPAAPDPTHAMIRSPCSRGEVVGRAVPRAPAPVMTRVAAIKARRGRILATRGTAITAAQSPTPPHPYQKEQEDEMADERLPQMAGARMGLARAAGSSARKRARG